MEIKDNNIVIEINELSKYSFKKENASSLSTKFGFGISSPNNEQESFELSEFTKQYEKCIDSVNVNLQLEKIIKTDKYNIVISGESDLIIFKKENYISETFKSVKNINKNINPLQYPDFFARSVIVSYMFMEQNGLSDIEMKMSFISKENGQKISFSSFMTFPLLSQLFNLLIKRVTPICERFYTMNTDLISQIKVMPFPYNSIRNGQELFIKEEYKAIIKKYNLIVSAPTGIGKTISSLFPAIKTISNTGTDKIFYFTSKTTTGNAAMEAINILSKYVPSLKACSIISKDTVCPLHDITTNRIVSRCHNCSLIDKNQFTTYQKSYQERQHEAITYLLDYDTSVYTKEIIKESAEKFNVCPYELSLDISEFCQIIICDCNYIIDSNIRFKRYFTENPKNEKFVFLFDEAHNLPDRTRNTYSIDISLDLFIKVSESLNQNTYPSLYKTLSSFILELEKIKKLCKESEYFKNTETGEIHCGYYKNNAIPRELINSCSNLINDLKELKNNDEVTELCSDIYDKLYKFNSIIPYFNEKFVFFADKYGETLKIKILCLDPSSILKQMLSPAISSVFFSATMSPLEYYAENIGIDNIKTLSLESPYDQDNCCIVTYDSISTRLNDRNNTAEDCAQVITETVSSRCGNYIVYFPSYEYLKKVCRIFADMMPECGIVMQKPNMSYKEKQKFIDIFRNRKYKSVVGFCVLGGMFSEGIDLSGESLIGTVIIGCGMPQLSIERNLMSSYYDEKCEKGYEYSYISPGINKVLQAAGRVIRSENDKGVIVIIDDRLNDPNIKNLFPAHWNKMKYTGNLSSLKIILESFWNFEK